MISTIPECFGKKYSDTDFECQSCDYKESCKPQTITNKGIYGSKPPVYGQSPNYGNNIVKPPTNIPIPNQSLPIIRPGTNGPGYYLMKHENESLFIRILKNLLLRALEAIFLELMLFFKNYTWTPRMH